MGLYTIEFSHTMIRNIYQRGPLRLTLGTDFLFAVFFLARFFAVGVPPPFFF